MDENGHHFNGEGTGKWNVAQTGVWKDVVGVESAEFTKADIIQVNSGTLTSPGDPAMKKDWIDVEATLLLTLIEESGSHLTTSYQTSVIWNDRIYGESYE